MIAVALAVSVAACSWDRPGANPFTGDVVAAVDRYQDIPVAAREALKARMAARRYDEMATITRDEIRGEHRYEGLRDMHFGGGTVCRTVTRDRWASGAIERGLVYCEQGHCLIVPTVCRNVSRVTRVPPAPPPDVPVRRVIEIPGGTGGMSWAQTLDLDDPTRDPVGRLTHPPSIDWTPDPLPAEPTQLARAVEPIPEPSTWAMMVLGVLLVAVAARRRWSKA
jgi:hypothetical protein